MLMYILFVAGFIILIKGADLLVDGASSIAARFNIPSLVIGLTIVAFGTSTPELFVNLMASFNGNTDIAIGNVLGSNIANVLLILGVAAVIYPLSVQSSTVWKEIPFSLLAAIALWVLANDALLDGAGNNFISRGDGLILLGFFSIFMVYVFEISLRHKPADDESGIKKMNLFRSVVYILLGLTGLVFGGKWIVDGAVHIAGLLGVSESLIGLTVVAVGTSLPELATSAVAAFRRNVDIAIGNVVGSNIFNVFFVLATSATIKPLPFNAGSNFDIYVVILSSALLFLFMFAGKRHRLERWQGIMFLVLYIGYTAMLVVKG
jgi:cation:H+ antiporter